MVCDHCGRPVPDDAILCPWCGENVRIRKRRRNQIQQDASDNNEQKHTQTDYHAEGRNRRNVENVQKDYQLGIPVHLAKSSPDQKANIRYVRHPSEQQPRMREKKQPPNPPIYKKSHKRLKTALVIVLFFAVTMFSATAYILIGTENGQRMMAQWGWSIAQTSAYVTLGKDLLDQGYYTKAKEMLSTALEREPRNVDALIYMAQAQAESGNKEDAIAIYESLVNDIAPEHPGAYRNLIRMYQEEGLNAEALALMQNASDKTGRQEFGIMLREYTPTAPVFSKLAGRYNEEIDVTISVPDQETVYYTLDGTDPSETGQIYEKGLVIHVPEGKMTLKAIGFTEDGVPTEQVEANYTVIIPTPAAPKANYASGKYKKAPKVSLRPGDEDAKKNKEIVAIYYTLDGRQATTASTLYTEPIQLPVGDCELRAISVAQNGKVSYEMRVTYSVEGNLKRKFTTDDTFRNLSLFRTTYSTFTKNYGTPMGYDLLPEEEWYADDMESYEAAYAWGSVRFTKKAGSSDPVLYSVDTKNEKMTGPRSTKVGMRGSDVMDKFQDLGHPALDEDGNRLLYNYNSGNYQFGTYRKEANGFYAIHYYTPVDDKHTIFLELSYYLNSAGKVERIVWQRYIAEIPAS